MDRGPWWSTLHRAAKRQPRLKRLNMHIHTLPLLCSLGNKLLKICDLPQREERFALHAEDHFIPVLH